MSVAEIPDSESNSGNSQIELVLHDEPEETTPTRKSEKSKLRRRAPVSASSLANGHDGPRVTTKTSSNGHRSSSTSEASGSGEATALITTISDEIKEFEFADDSLPSSPVKYVSHPNDYLPVYRSNGDMNGTSSSAEIGFSSQWVSAGDINSKKNGKRSLTAVSVTDSSNDNIHSSSAVDLHTAKPVSIVDIDINDPGYDGDHHHSDNDSLERQSTFV